MFRILCAFVLIIALTNGECPAMNELPVMTDAGDNFYCAFVWDNWGGKDQFEGCNGNNAVWLKGEDKPNAEPEDYYGCGSIIVKPGCTFYGYEVFFISANFLEFSYRY